MLWNEGSCYYTMLVLSIFHREVCKSTRVNIDIRYAEERVTSCRILKKLGSLVAEVYHVPQYYVNPS